MQEPQTAQSSISVPVVSISSVRQKAHEIFSRVGVFPGVFTSTLHYNGLPSKFSDEQPGGPLLWWKDKEQWTHVETRQVQAGYKEQYSHPEYSQAVEQVAGELMQAPSLEGFKTCLEKAPGSRV